MPLDFPSSPTNGQTYENFVYDTSITAWRNQGSPSGLAGQVVALDNKVGLKQLIPTAITLAGGTGSITSNGTISFSACTSVAIQGVFSSLYRNYKIILNITPSAGGNVNYYLMTGATANTANVYYNQELRVLDTTVQGAFVGWPTTNGIAAVGVTPGNIAMDVYAPNISTVSTGVMSDANMGGSYYIRKYHNRHGVEAAFDGINFQASGGSHTGTITVYGYED